VVATPLSSVIVALTTSTYRVFVARPADAVLDEWAELYDAVLGYPPN
jgi:hypothetical protein